MNDYERALALQEETVAHRRYLHTNAEVGLVMPKAKAYVMEKLTQFGLNPTECGNGVTATVGHGGKCILLRADMDALPMTEESGESTVSVRDTVSLTIAKAICPSSVSGGGSVGYTFVIQNTGNTPVVVTDNLVVRDTFNPLLTDITVTLDGVELVEGVGYTYNELTGEFATLPGVVSVPAAVYTRDPVSGALITTPGNAVLTVVGAI